MSRLNKGFHTILEKDHQYIFIDACVQIWEDSDFVNSHRHGVTVYSVSFEGLTTRGDLERALESIMYFHCISHKYPNILIIKTVDDIYEAKNILLGFFGEIRR